MMTISLGDPSAVILDLDGVVYRGSSLRLGVNELLYYLERRGIIYHYFTNISDLLPGEIVDKLAALGLKTAKDKITTSSEVAAHFLKEKNIKSPLITIGGGRGLSDELISAGINQVALEIASQERIGNLKDIYRAVCPLLIGWTDNYNYGLAAAILQIESCISDVYATDDDTRFPSVDGNLPGTAWINGSIQCLLSKKPLVLGKPNPFSLLYVLGKIGVEAEKTLVIGDNLFTDINVGRKVGCNTLLLLGGATSEADLNLNQNLKPDLVLNELTEIEELHPL